MLCRWRLVAWICAASIVLTSVRAKNATVQLLSPEGADMLHGAIGEHYAFPAVAVNLQTQINQAFCAVATSVTILNALEKKKAPVDFIFYPFRYFTQRDIFETKCAAEVDTGGSRFPFSSLYVATHGASLEQTTKLLSCYAEAEMYLADNATIDEFRDSVRTTLKSSGFVAVNVDRDTLHQIGTGHFSPVAAFNEVNDTMLFMDVARFKYAPVWFPVPLLFSSMQTVDATAGESRGWIAVQSSDYKPDAVPPPPYKFDFLALRECVMRNWDDEADAYSVIVNCWKDVNYTKRRSPWRYVLVAIISAATASVATLFIVTWQRSRREGYQEISA